MNSASAIEEAGIQPFGRLPATVGGVEMTPTPSAFLTLEVMDAQCAHAQINPSPRTGQMAHELPQFCPKNLLAVQLLRHRHLALCKLIRCARVQIFAYGKFVLLSL